MEKSHTTTGNMSIFELSTNHLFEKYTVEEIRKLEKDTRDEIEKKKEDLRQMVGERYRDLIEAADTITEMKSCTEKIVVSIQDMQQHCVRLQKTHFTKGISMSPKKASASGSHSSGFYAIASQTKLLLDIPEKMWSDIESGDHLHATQLYLLTCHIVSSLQLDTTTHQSTQLLKWFPVLSRQWAAICHFKPSILQSCRNILRNATTPDMMIAKSLCAIMLLEDSSPRQVFTEFLLARKNAVHQAFSSPQYDTSVKKQVCGVTDLINMTLRQIFTVFYNQETDQEDEDSNFLLKVLTEVTSVADGQTVLADELAVGTFAKHLPAHITDFHPTLHTTVSPITAVYLQECVSQWVETCVTDVQDGISKLLSYVTSIRGLTSIRDAVHDLLQENGDGIPWSTVAKKVVGRSLCLWGEFVRPLFVTRIQAIIQDSLDQTLTNSHQLVIQASQDMDSSPADLDVAAHTWKELSSDLPGPTAWQAGAGHRDVLDAGSLYMKAKAFTPKTQSICSFIDVRLKSLLEDLGCYTDKETDKPHQMDRQTPATRTSKGPFDKFADTVTLHNFLQIACAKCVKRLVDHIKGELNDCWSSLETSQETELQDQSSITINRVVFLGRLCSALTELSPHLQVAMMVTERKDQRAEQRLRSKVAGKRISKSSHSTDDEWSKAMAAFHQQCQEAYRIWSHFTSSCLLEELSCNLRDTSPAAILKYSTAWDTIEIEEETEDGCKVSSKIRLPVQSSWYVQSMLYGLCEEINRVGGHALSRLVVSALVKKTSSGLLTAYQSFIKERSGKGSGEGEDRLTQPQALQLLFDIRFIGSIMSGRGEDKKDNALFTDQLQGIIDTLEGFIDPFDLDVFTPHMTSNLNRHAHRCSLLLGFLTSPDRQLFSGHRSSAAGYQEHHNILPLTSAQVRFSLLPLSTTTSSSKLTLQPTVPRQKQAQKALYEIASPMEAILHKSRSSPASLSSRLSSSLKSGWLSNLGGQS